MGMTEQGIQGEQTLKRYLAGKGITFFQPDGIGLDQEHYVLYEVKCLTEPFQPPPFLGHGLFIYQIKARLAFQDKTGIRIRFMVFNTKDNSVCSAWLDELEQGEHFDTAKGIRIYPIENFEIEITTKPAGGTVSGNEPL